MDTETSERLDLLLSISIDDELDEAERAELDRLLASSPEIAAAAEARRVAFRAADEALLEVASAPLGRRGIDVPENEAALDAGLAALRERIATESGAPGASNIRWLAWSVPLAAAAAGFFLLTGDSFRNGTAGGDTASGDGPETRSEYAETEIDPLSLALLFEIETEWQGQGGSAPTSARLPALEAGDLEVIERLELMEFLASRSAGEQG
jgi:hypothetical protein